MYDTKKVIRFHPAHDKSREKHTVDGPTIIRSRKGYRTVIIPELSLEEVSSGRIETTEVVLNSRIVA